MKRVQKKAICRYKNAKKALDSFQFDNVFKNLVFLKKIYNVRKSEKIFILGDNFGKILTY
jgi:hypothetical protein